MECPQGLESANWTSFRMEAEGVAGRERIRGEAEGRSDGDKLAGCQASRPIAFPPPSPVRLRLMMTV